MTTPLPSADAALSPLDADTLQRARAAAHHFVRPRRGLGSVEEGEAPTAAPVRAVAVADGELRYWVEGDGPPVLLVHGWEGRPADLASMAEALRAAGRAIAWVELPAHGGSGIAWTSVPHAAAALARLGAALGPVQGVIAHSVGGAVTVLALGQGLRAARVVLVAAPAEYREYAHAFAHRFGLDRQGTAAMLQVLADQYGVTVGAVSTPAAARGLDLPALIVHAHDDAVVPFRDAERIAAAWPRAVLRRVDGLGHRRVLSDPFVVAAAVEHVVA